MKVEIITETKKGAGLLINEVGLQCWVKPQVFKAFKSSGNITESITKSFKEAEAKIAWEKDGCIGVDFGVCSPDPTIDREHGLSNARLFFTGEEIVKTSGEQVTVKWRSVQRKFCKWTKNKQLWSGYYIAITEDPNYWVQG